MAKIETGIDEALEKVTGVAKRFQESLTGDTYASLMTYQVRTILLLSTAYDYFLLEEEGRLNDLLRRTYNQRDLGYVPRIIHVSTEESAKRLIEANQIDLIVIFNTPSGVNVFSLSEEIKGIQGALPVVFLANNTPELLRISRMEAGGNIDRIFTWEGDGKIFLSIVQFVEDMVNIEQDLTPIGPRCILILERSLRSYSKYIPIIYEELWNQSEALMKDDLTFAQKTMRQKRRPKVAMVSDIHQAFDFISSYGKNILTLIIDTDGTERPKHDQSQDMEFIAQVKMTHPSLPVMIICSNEQDIERFSQLDAVTLHKHSSSMFHHFRMFVRERLGLIDLVFTDERGKEVSRATDMRTFERSIWSAPEDVILRYLTTDAISHWLISRTEFELAKEFDTIREGGGDGTSIRERLIDTIREHKKKAFHGAIVPYSRSDIEEHVRFSRIGTGALGGKARGLAFMDKVLSTYIQEDRWKGVTITIPRTVVVCTDIFDDFITQNQLLDVLDEDLPDERIAAVFAAKDLPARVLGDLRAFLKDTRGPLAIRSSSMLEDALFQPFAGVYSSVMIPNDSFDLDQRFTALSNAIKHVYASTYFKKARDYIRTTPNEVQDEKMGIVIQEIVGHSFGSRYYPAISGVAKSFNFYPVGKCRPEEGVANIALGLGKTIVDGGLSFRFCPARPKVPHYGTIKELLGQSQKDFFAISLESKDRLRRDDEGPLVKLGLEVAEDDGVLDHIASTYSPMDDRLYPGINREGPRVLDFAAILQLGRFPLAEVLELLLKVSEIALGCPVEIEFALNLDPKDLLPAHIAFLQVRSMVSKDDFIEIELGNFREEDLLCRSGNALGNGVRDDIMDIVMVRPQSFNLAKTKQIRTQVSQFNTSLVEKGKPFLLIGPGRWGSSDPWLGIPVIWSDIAGAAAIVETPVEQRHIDPSEGSHFFHNMTSAKVGYFTIGRNKQDLLDWDWLTSLTISGETEEVCHMVSPHPLEIRIDGRSRKGVILKRASEG